MARTESSTLGRFKNLPLLQSLRLIATRQPREAHHSEVIRVEDHQKCNSTPRSISPSSPKSVQAPGNSTRRSIQESCASIEASCASVQASCKSIQARRAAIQASKSELQRASRALGLSDPETRELLLQPSGPTPLRVMLGNAMVSVMKLRLGIQTSAAKAKSGLQALGKMTNVQLLGWMVILICVGLTVTMALWRPLGGHSKVIEFQPSKVIEFHPSDFLYVGCSRLSDTDCVGHPVATFTIPANLNKEDLQRFLDELRLIAEHAERV